MTKNEMLNLYYNENYDKIQNLIKNAMQKGEHYIHVGREGYGWDPDYVCTDKTKSKLLEDGFEILEASYDEWQIQW